MLKNKLSNKPFCNDLHFLFIGVVILLISIKYPVFYILLLLYSIFIWKKTRYFIPLLVILIVIYGSYKIRNLLLEEEASGIYDGTYEVIEVHQTNLILKKETKYIVYITNTNLMPGDKINAILKVTPLSKASYLGDFDAWSYYRAKGITNQAKFIQYEKTSTTWKLNRLRYIMLEYYEKKLGTKSFAYLKALFFGIEELESNIKEAYTSLYLTHILAISGLHIHFLYATLLACFRKIFKIKGEKLAVSIVGIYVLFIGFPIPSLRAFAFLLLKLLNRKGHIHYTDLDILSITYIAMVIFFPLYAFQIGFILSFLISFILLFIQDFEICQTKILRKIFTSLLCIITILPFLINQNHTVSIIGILLSVLFGYGLSLFVLPMILIMLIFPNAFYEGLFYLIDQILLLSSQHTYPIKLPYLSLIWIVLYYILLVYILICFAKRKKKYTILYFIIYFCLLLSVRLCNIYYRITFIDVGQGDSILIEFPHNKGNVLVDSYNNLDYLNQLGLRSFDYVVLTHFDKDHMDTIEEVLTSYKVKNLVYSEFEDVGKIQNLNVNKVAASSGDSFAVEEVVFHVLGPIQAYDDANSNSIVLFFTIHEYQFLLTGDMTEKEEKDLIQKYNDRLNCDILKVGHHGSATSSSEPFLALCSPTYSIISVGENNVYGLPNLEIVSRLEKYSTVYMTKDKGNIVVQIGKKLVIKPYR